MSPGVPEVEGVYASRGVYMRCICHWGHPFFEDVPKVGFMYLVFTRMPGRVTVGESGLCCCVPCLMSAVSSRR